MLSPTRKSGRSVRRYADSNSANLGDVCMGAEPFAERGRLKARGTLCVNEARARSRHHFRSGGYRSRARGLTILRGPVDSAPLAMNTQPGIFGRKVGSTQVFEPDGTVTRVTVVE